MPDSGNSGRTPEAVEEFLRVLQDHERRSGVTRPVLAREAAALERARYGGRLPAGRQAWIGHAKDGSYNEKRLSDELKGRGRLPVWELVLAVAHAYAEHNHEPRGEVVARLEALYTAAVRAREASKATARESGQGLPSWPEYNAVRGERDQAHEAARTASAQRDEAQVEAETAARERDLAAADRDEARADRARDRARLDSLQHAYINLAAAVATATAASAAATEEHQREIQRHQQRVDELDQELEALRQDLAEERRAREAAELATSDAHRRVDAEARRADVQERRAGALRAEADRLAGDVERLQRRLAQDDPPREDPGPEFPPEELLPGDPRARSGWEVPGASAPAWDREQQLRLDPHGDGVAPERDTLVAGVDDDALHELLFELKRGQFTPGPVGSRHDRYRVVRWVLLHVCGAALEVGVLLPGRHKPWVPGRSSIGVKSWLLPTSMTITVLVEIIAALHGLTWDAWWPPVVAVAAGVALVCAPPVRRVLPVLVPATILLGAIGLGLARSRPPSSPGDIMVAVFLTSLVLCTTCIGLSRARTRELFYDEVVRAQTGGQAPSLALYRVLRGSAAPSATGGDEAGGQAQLVPGIPDTIAREILDDLRAGNFSHGAVGLERSTAVRVCAAARAAGLSPKEMGEDWRQGRSSTEFGNGCAVLGVVMVVMVALVLLVVGGLAGQLGVIFGNVTWGAWLLPLLLVAAGWRVGSVARVRRVLPGSVLLAYECGAVALGLGWLHLPTNAGNAAVTLLTTDTGDTTVALLMSIFVVFSVFGTAMVRSEELFFDEVAAAVADDTDGPTPALRCYIEHEQAHAAAEPVASDLT